MATSPDITALAAYAGLYEKQLFSTLVNELDAVTDLTLIQDVKNKLNMTKLRAGNGARPYSVGTTARAGDLAYTGRVLEVTQGKRDLEVEPLKYRSTWMSEVMRPGVNPDDMPFAAYVWAQVMKELAAEINDKTVYFGFDKATAAAYAGGTAYAVGDYMIYTAADGFDDYWKCISATTAGQTPVTHPAKWLQVNAEAISVGFGVRLAAAITAGLPIAPVATGALTNTTAYDQFTSVWRALPIAYRKAGATIFAGWNSTDLLADDFETRVTKYTETDPATGKVYLSKTNRKCQIIPATWMGSSGRLICTPKENMLIGTDRISDLNKINTFQKLRTMEAGIDFVIGTQIRDLSALVVNNVA